MTTAAWGKTDAERRPSHALIHHSMDVAAVLEGLLCHPVLSRRLDTAAGRALTSGDRAWLAAFAFLHDIGKLSPAFQSKAWPEAERVMTRSHLDEGIAWISEFVAHRHDAMGGAAMALLEPLFQSGNSVAWRWLDALFAHHGRPIEAKASRTFETLAHYDWRAEEARMGEALAAWFPDAAPSRDLFDRHRLVHLFAGLLALADWIGSDETSFAHELAPDVPGYGARARERAAEALAAIGLASPDWPDEEPSFKALTTYDQPRGAQALVRDLPLDARLAILEAETGSGKTEAALWHFARLRSAGLVDALYFAVPTRAAASQLQHRIDEAMRRVDGPEAILAVPGQLKAGEATGRRLPGFEVLWDDDAGADRRRWAAAHATRYLAAPIAVGTVDQALMAGLRIKHAHLRGAALARSLLVIDEVHASDAYMNRIARGLVRNHLALGGHAFLMSATLGSGERAAWLGRTPPCQPAATAAPYPALWYEGAETPLFLGEKAPERKKTVRPVSEATMAPERAAALAIKAAEQGARVLVIRNTVDMAIATWHELVAERPDLCLEVGGGAALHHSRFAAEDRQRLDEAIESSFGKGSTASGIVAIGTQTLEQSLDIDADLLIADLCPMDVLLQRIGRLHRHDRARPAGFDEAQVVVMVPEGGLDRLARGPAFENGLGSWAVSGGAIQGVYLDLRGIEATRRLVAAGGTWSIPAGNRRLVEAATHADALDEIERETGWQDYAERVIAKALAETGHASALVLDRAAPFPSAFPDADETVQTRLGARGPMLTLPEGTIGPFGQPITRITPPAHWCAGLTGDEDVTVTPVGEGLRLDVGDRAFLYDRAGLRRPSGRDG